ncbi:Uncharacterised protein [Acinetobacter baumannii]|nr:Uncharacterised protein [Acinetobacter baumannii]SSS40088.1 Uncharacterised protein [Acinetobacter baumannii]SSU43852.1 Uncharacterised protein [Acinetobacter baumannii]SVK02411.1 Uncharacterised protein [Acinetobacter baumannii]
MAHQSLVRNDRGCCETNLEGVALTILDVDKAFGR